MRSADWITRLITGAIIVVGLVLALLEESDGAPLRSGWPDALGQPVACADAPCFPSPMPVAVAAGS